ncbi:MAG: choice-of-anchor V domain-containing protein [Bacteroidota bacterium]
MKKYVLSFAAITALGMSISLLNNQSNLYSNRSGAPAQGNCTSCHLGSLQTSNDIMFQVLDGATPVTTYTPGKKYTVSIMAHGFTNARFGFALSGNAGSFNASGEGTAKGSVGDYVTHTNAGTAADAGGGKMWEAEWTAPASGSVALQLYLNAANNDGDNTGDKIYGKTINLTMATGLSAIVNEKSFAVYPNPVVDVLNIDFDLKESSDVNISLVDVNGKLIKEFASGKMNSGKQHFTFTNNLSQGLYFVKVQAGEQSFSKRIFIK